VLSGKSHNNGLDRSLAEMGCKFDGDKHDPYWDSYNAARVLVNLIKKTRNEII
jgi:inhibitor of KinA sporulation pathway (predicted exonuclease)